MEIRYEFFESFDPNELRLMSHLEWWSEKTFLEQKMLEKTVDFLLKNLLFAVLAFDGDNLIGAAGLIPCLKNNTTKMHYKDNLVVELASNYVDPLYRDSHIASHFVDVRLSFCILRKLFPVSVTSSLYIQKIFEKKGLLMKDFTEYDEIYRGVRVCDCSSEQKIHNKVCPLADKAIWIFRDFI